MICCPPPCCTFCCLNPEGGSENINSPKSETSPPPRWRLFLRAIITHRIFDMMIMVVIAVNIVCLAMDLPNIPDDRRAVLFRIELVCLCVFSVEVVMSMLAYGLFVENGYFRSGWNCFDLIVVILGWLSLELEVANFSSLRALRALRVLRTTSFTSHIAGVRIMMDALIDSLPQLLTVLFVLLFSLSCFAIMAVQLWKGVLSRRCYFNESGILRLDESQLDRCGPRGRPCDGPTICLEPLDFPTDPCIGACPYEEPVLSYDHMGLSLLQLFRLFTLDNWQKDCDNTQNASSYATFLFYFIVTISVSLFAVNLLLGVLQNHFTEAADRSSYEVPGSFQLRRKPIRRINMCDPNKSFYTIAQLALSAREEASTSTANMIQLSPRTTSMRYIVSPRDYVPSPRHRQEVVFNIPTLESLQNQNNPLETTSDTTESTSVLPAADTATNIMSSSSVPDMQHAQHEPETFQEKLKKFRKKLAYLCDHRFSRAVMLIVTVYNVLVLSVDHHNAPDSLANLISNSNFACTIIFTVEMAVKLVAFGPRRYAKDIYNIVDCLLVVISWIEVGLSSSSGFSAFRAFRLSRVLVLAVRWKSLQQLMFTIVHSMQAALYLIMIAILFIFTFAVFGAQLFIVSSDKPQFSYNSLWEALLTVFIIITGDNWADIMSITIQSSSYFSCAYFIVVYSVGNYLLLNMFICILVDNFARGRKEQEINEKKERVSEWKPPKNKRKSERIFHPIATRQYLYPTYYAMKEWDSGKMPPIPEEYVRYLSDPEAPDFDFDTVTEAAILVTNARQRGITRSRGLTGSFGKAREKKKKKKKKEKRSHSTIDLHYVDKTEFDTMTEDITNHVLSDLEMTPREPRQTFWLQYLEDWEANKPKQEKSTLEQQIQTYQPNWRRKLASVVLHPLFENSILLLILINAGLLAWDDPFTRDSCDSHSNCSTKEWILFVSNIVFTIIFFFEMILKLLLLKKSYFKGWNILDMLVVILSIIGLFTPILRSMRVLRVLRLLPRIPSVRVLTTTLLRAMPGLSHVVVLLLFLWFLFAVLGVQLFKGRYFSCRDLRKRVVPFDQDECARRPNYDWNQPRYNFDNIGIALVSLNILAIRDEWSEIMWNAVNSRGIGEAPSRNASPYYSVFFVVFVTAGSFIGMKLFIGVLIDELAAKQDRYFMTEEQRAWVRSALVASKTALPDTVIPPSNQFQRMFWSIAAHNMFELFITSCIIINTIFMTLEHYQQSDQWKTVLEGANLAFVIIFAVEAVMKILAYGPRRYIINRWNQFDAAVVVVSLVGLAVKGPGATAVRIFRVARILRLVKRAKQLNRIVLTTIIGLPQIINVLALCAVIFFIYGVVGVQIFGRIPYQGNVGLTRNSNFQDLYHALPLLYMASTGQGWSTFLEGCVNDMPGCQNNNSCGTPGAYFYWNSFMILCSFVLLNTSIAVVLQNWETPDEHRLEKWLEEFRLRWSMADPEVSQKIHLIEFVNIICTMSEPIGLGRAIPDFKLDDLRGVEYSFILSRLMEMIVPITKDRKVEYIQALCGLVRFLLDIDLDTASAVIESAGVPNFRADAFGVHHYMAMNKIISFIRNPPQRRLSSNNNNAKSTSSPSSSTPLTEIILTL